MMALSPQNPESAVSEQKQATLQLTVGKRRESLVWLCPKVAKPLQV